MWAPGPARGPAVESLEGAVAESGTYSTSKAAIRAKQRASEARRVQDDRRLAAESIRAQSDHGQNFVTVPKYGLLRRAQTQVAQLHLDPAPAFPGVVKLHRRTKYPRVGLSPFPKQDTGRYRPLWRKVINKKL